MRDFIKKIIALCKYKFYIVHYFMELYIAVKLLLLISN